MFMSVLLGITQMPAATDVRHGMLEGFAHPPGDCRPQTRWWWPGNALTKEEIDLVYYEHLTAEVGPCRDLDATVGIVYRVFIAAGRSIGD